MCIFADVLEKWGMLVCKVPVRIELSREIA